MTLLPYLLALQIQAPGVAAQLDAQVYPVMTPSEPYAAYDARERAWWITRWNLVTKLYAEDPNNERVLKILPNCWAVLGPETTRKQIHEILAGKPPAPVEGLARATRAQFQLKALAANHTDADVMAIWADMAAHSLYTDAAADVLFNCTKLLKDKVNRTREYRILAQLYPGYERLKEVAEDLKDWSGRPNFELDFKEVCTNKPDSICAKRGKVILIYFSKDGGAPEAVHDLYVRYHNAGLEAIGIAATTKPSPMPWPLVADANLGVRKSWGVEKDQTVFLVDKEGCLAYANPTDMETHVKELLAQR